MQVIAAGPTVTVGQRLALVRSAVVATLLLAAAASLAWLCISTPLVGRMVPLGRPSDSQAVLGIALWAAVLVVPASLVLLGLSRFAETLEAAAALRPRPLRPVVRAALGNDALAATGLRLPGGRRVNELVLGPFGIVVVGEVPPPSVSRNVGPRWEIRDSRGRWIPVEGPLDRAARDAERVRGWLGADDRDFIVKVHAVVVSTDPRVARTPACAVVGPDDLAAWLAALPPQRGLTPGRRARVEQMVRGIASNSSGEDAGR